MIISHQVVVVSSSAPMTCSLTTHTHTLVHILTTSYSVLCVCVSRESAGLYTIDPMGCWFSFLNAYTFLLPETATEEGVGERGSGFWRRWETGAAHSVIFLRFYIKPLMMHHEDYIFSLLSMVSFYNQIKKANVHSLTLFYILYWL